MKNKRKKRVLWNLSLLQELAVSRGGECLSEEYVSGTTKMLWKCSDKHIWEIAARTVTEGGWCPACAGNKKHTIEEAQDLAKIKNGQCLSSEYNNNQSHLLWLCQDNHTWLASFNSISSGRWCPKCAGCIPITIKDAQKLAKEKNGKCFLSNRIDGKPIYFLWECHNGHRWHARYSCVNSGRWCPDCAGNKRLSMKDVENLAEKVGGVCLSKKYKNSYSKLEWKCANSHIWNASYQNVKNGRWCKICSSSKSQKKLFEIIKDIYNTDVKFNFRGFGWLKTKNTGKQELDIFVTKIKLAIEYDGQQHFMPVRFGGISYKEAEKALKKTRELDKLKNKKIAQNSKDISYFIRFKYDEPIEKDYVLKKLAENNIPVP